MTSIRSATDASRQHRDELVALVQGYIASVLDGSRVVGKYERLCVERHVRDLESGNPKLRFDQDAALHILEFAVRYVRHTKGSWARKPFRFCTRSAWIAFLLWCLFGWQRLGDDGNLTRRYRRAYVSIARKNGKTMIAAIVALYMLAFDGEAGAEVYFAATKRDQAKIGWRQAANIVQKCPDKRFRKLFRVTESTAHINLTEDAESFCCALGRDKDSQDGTGPHCAVVDEIHAHKDGEQWDVLESGTGARAQPMMFGITTAGSRKQGICWDLEHDGQRVLERVIEDETMFVYIARPDESDPWDSDVAIEKANPNLGVSVFPDALRDMRQAALNSPARQNVYRMKRVNCWTEGETAWLPVELWERCAGTVDLSRFEGRECVVGVDVSQTSDFTAAVAIFRGDDGHYYAKPRLWIPAGTVTKRVREDKVPVNIWREQGWVHVTEGEIIDQDAVKMWILNLADRHTVREIPLDQTQAWKLMGELENLGQTAVKFRQGYISMGPAVAETERLIKAGAAKEAGKPWLIHDGNPAMRWMFRNCSTLIDPAGNVKLDKSDPRDRIDGIIALVMAVARAVILSDVASVYDARGVITL